MALSEKQRQKKIEKKNKKRKLSGKPSSPLLQLGSKAASYAKFPVHECLVPDTLFVGGIGSVIIARKTPQGDIAISAFAIDVYCLGVKNAAFKITSELDYERGLKGKLIASSEGQNFEQVHIACVKKLIEGAVRYAKGLGFSPHADYHNAKGIFDGVDATACPVSYTYGREGKPFYVQGPFESLHQSEQILDKLHKACGEGGYGYLLSIGEENLH